MSDMWEPSNSIWGTPIWPAWMTHFRDHQKDAIADAYAHFLNGADVVMINAPTGSGKTIIAEGVRRLLEHKHNLYVANTKGLQDQFAADFSYARVLKGRSNYPTADHPELFEKQGFGSLNAGDCTKTFTELPGCDGCDTYTDNAVPHCLNCHPVSKCGYEVALRAAMSAPLAVTNTAYFLSEANGPGRFSSAKSPGSTREVLRPNQFVVVDECDTLEPILMGLTETSISDRQRKSYELEMPDKKTVADAWLPWASDVALPRIESLYLGIQSVWMHQRDGQNGTYWVWNDKVPTKIVRDYKAMGNLIDRLTMLKQDLALGNAVFDGYQQGDIRFKPIRVDHYGPTKVWQHAQRWLLMSATVIDPIDMVESLGIERAGLRWELVNVPSTFAPANRPIVVKGLANMTRKEKDTSWPKMVDGVAQVLDKHPGDRVLVHTVSYDLAQYLRDALVMQFERPMLTYKNEREREDVLDVFKKRDASVLFAPSMDRGVDLPEDDCRVVIVAKIPFPNMGDKQVSARMHTKGGQLWYAVQTIRSLVQMTGRGVRSATDTCTTYVLDAQFTDNVWKKSRRLLPDWWIDALDWSGGGLVRRKV